MLDVHDTGSSWRVMRVEGGIQAFEDAKGLIWVQRDQNYRELWRWVYPDYMSLPERTRVNVALLRLCDKRGKIPGVGQKVSDNTFWLEENPALLEAYGDVV